MNMWPVLIVAAAIAHSTRTEIVTFFDTEYQEVFDGWTSSRANTLVVEPYYTETGWKVIPRYQDLPDEPDIDAVNWAEYNVCDMHHHNVDNWLWTPFIQHNATRLHIKINYLIETNCSSSAHDVVTCKDSFSAFYYETDDPSKESPPFKAEKHKFLGTITDRDGPYGTFYMNQRTNVEIKAIDVSKRGLYLAFRDQGACIVQFGVKVFYEIRPETNCPEWKFNLARYPVTVTDYYNNKTVIGKCVENAELGPGENLTYICQPNGEWVINWNKFCICSAGFEPDANQVCKECPPGKFKPNAGNELCESPPPNPTSTQNKEEDIAQNSPKNTSVKSVKSPSPNNLTVTFGDEVSITLHWPSTKLGRNDIKQRVRCANCDSTVEYNIEESNRNNIKLTIMDAEDKYKVQVLVENKFNEEPGV